MPPPLPPRVSVASLQARLRAPFPPTLVDVRRAAAFERDPVRIPLSLRGDPEGVDAWASDLDDWRDVVDTNLGSVFFTCRAVSRGMMRRKSGSIVNVSSIVGLRGNWGQTNYAASKAGIIGFTKSLARELGSRGVRANVVAPGYINTRLTDVLPEEARDAMLANTPLGKLGDPEDVAGAVRFLCSDEASFITGGYYLVDGGYTAI